MRMRRMMTGKIHRVRVTGADLHYVGSVTVDSLLLKEADILPGQEVDIVDVTNGARLTTYVIPGEPGSGVINVNGAAAHLIHEGDIAILITYSMLEEAEAHTYEPKVVFVDEHNHQVHVGDEPGQVPGQAHAADGDVSFENSADAAAADVVEGVRSSGITFGEFRSLS